LSLVSIVAGMRRLPVAIGVTIAATLTVSATTVAVGHAAPVPAAGAATGAVVGAGQEPAAVTAGPTRRLVLESAPLVAARAVRQPAALAPAAAPHVQATGYTPSAAEARLPLPPVTHAQNDSLGSTICAHEQCAPPVDAAAA